MYIILHNSYSVHISLERRTILLVINRAKCSYCCVILLVNGVAKIVDDFKFPIMLMGPLYSIGHEYLINIDRILALLLNNFINKWGRIIII